MIGPDSTVNAELPRALLELSDAARALGLAADQIESQPNSLIFGKKGSQVMKPRAARAGLAASPRSRLPAPTPPPEFYTLSSASGAAAGAAIASRPELGLAVGPLELPRYLDRPRSSRATAAHRLVVADAHRWGGSLRSDILRVVADDLGRLLGTARVAIYPAEPRFPAGYRVLLDIREFEGVPGDKVALRVRWTIAAMPDGRAVVVEESRIEQPVASASYEDLVAAESAALGTVTRQIAERVAEMTTR